jgi:hypothetical protein
MLLFMTFALMLALPATMVFADSLAIDADGFETSNSKNSKFVLCQGAGSYVDVDATLNYSGTGPGAKHFNNGSTVTITTTVQPEASSFITAAGGSTTLSGWNTVAASASVNDMRLTVGDNWTAGTYQVTYKASGTGTDNKALVLEDTNNVQISAATTGCSTSGGGDDGGGTPPPPANTAPSVDVTGVEDGASYEIGSVPTPGCSVDDAEDTNEATAPAVGAITGTLSAYGLGSQTVTCSYTDSGTPPLSGSDTETYTIVDTGNPTISDMGATSAPNGADGWYVSAVTNQFEASDSGAGFQTATPKLLSYLFSNPSGAAEGSAVKINSGSVSDVAGNAAAAIDSAAYKIDLSDPVLNVSGAANGAVFNVCDAGPGRPSFAPTDAISGLDGSQADSWTTPSAASGVGTYTYQAAAKDIAGRTASETRTYNKTYGASYGGVTQPINGGATVALTDDDSRFKLGSTVPVKFRMTCGTTPIDNAVAKLNVKKADGTPDPGVDEAVSTAASTTGNLFRYDATSGQYIFNLSTKTGYTNPNGTTVSFAAGTYTLSILLDDGSFRSVNIHIVR